MTLKNYINCHLNRHIPIKAIDKWGERSRCKHCGKLLYNLRYDTHIETLGVELRKKGEKS